MNARRDRALALALGGGGARAAYQGGVIAHIGKRMPDFSPPILTGVSAGSINLAFLAGSPGRFGDSSAAIRQAWLRLRTQHVFDASLPRLLWGAVRLGAAVVAGRNPLSAGFRSVVGTSPLRQILANALPSGAIQSGIDAGRFRSVGISAASYQTGRTTLFSQGWSPRAPRREFSHLRHVFDQIGVEHVMASAAIPLLFPAVKIGQQYYGDGSFRSPSPLAPAVRLGADRIFTISTRSRPPGLVPQRADSVGYPPPARILGLLLNSVFLDTLDWDTAHLERTNELVARLGPANTRNGPRHIDLFVLRPSEDIGQLAGEFERTLPSGLRRVVRGLSGRRSKTADFLSYLMFEPEYLSRLIALGERDAEANWGAIAAFLSGAGADHPG